MASAERIKRLIVQTCRDVARAEVVRQFGMAWRGGRFVASYLTGRIPFLVLPENSDTVLLSIAANSDSGTQSITYDDPYPGTTLPSGATAGAGTATVASTAGMSVRQTVRFVQAGGSPLTETHKLTAVNHATKVLTFAGTLAHTYAASATVLVIPDVVAGSHDIGWVADADAVSITTTGFDLTLARRVSLTNSEAGTVIDPATGAAPKILAGNTFVDTAAISFPTAYQSTPDVHVQTGDPEYTAVAHSITATQFVVRVTHTPTAVSGLISTDNTGITAPGGSTESTDDDAGSTTTSPTPTDTDATGGAGSGNATGNNSDGTQTGSTGGHTHHIASPGASTDTDSAGGHDHVHNTSGGTHTHQMPSHAHHYDHTHNVAVHRHLLNDPGHTHTFSGTATAVTADTSVPCQWIAWGTRTAPAVTKEASWIARGA